MGVSGLLPMFRGSTQTVHVSRYTHEVVAIDGYAWLHRGVHACASELGAGGASDKHIEFCMGRVALLLHYKVKPLLVFDGGALPAKAAQEASRRGKREHAKAMASQKAREDSQEEARKWYAKCSTPSAQQVVLADLFAAGPDVSAIDVRSWTQHMFVTMCALAGCDYVDVEAVKNARRLVARYKDRMKVLRALK
ncbi:hypothetical protein AURANDRAFT_67936 [Aureococcus anophagefferens]|nr:hypothetical protein AURANDRAFT_67936 [Aureococcus anophagefferens]EGB03505.1 hypothetical protein AURANDRAFT_67936 [Aureococcus anophagefferens]|eukprot:XP_009041772.1 hypothetical protein AURANDRAFT_67936 [Aureococcus anophagefferens]